MSEHGKLIGPGTLEFHRRFEADIDKVWQFLVDPEKRKLWFCSGQTEDHVGGKIVFEFDHRRLSESSAPEKYADEVVVTHQGEILEFDPPHRFAFTWFEDVRDTPSTVSITLEANDDGSTSLHLVHENVNGRDIIVSVLAGWHGHFDLLSEVLQGERKTDFWVRDQELEADYETRV